jgi:hypothetical protein
MCNVSNPSNTGGASKERERVGGYQERDLTMKGDGGKIEFVVPS